MRIIHLILFLTGIGVSLAGPSSGRPQFGLEETKVETLCARMHNNTAFIGAEPFARLLVDSASKCQKSCMDLHPKCTAVVFYYVFGEKVNHICFLFDRNSVNENVALVPEKPKNNKDVVRALEIVSNCHEFDPFPPLPDPFVFSSDIVGREKRSIGFDKPIHGTSPWTAWTSCKPGHSQIRSQTCEYGRKIQKRQCAARHSMPQQPIYVPAQMIPTAAPLSRYPPTPYSHPPIQSEEYMRRMQQHKQQELQLCCYKLETSGQQVHPAVASAAPCPAACPVVGIPGAFGNGSTYSTYSEGSSLYTPDPGTAGPHGPGVTTYGQPGRPSIPGVPTGISPEIAGGYDSWKEWSPCSASCGLGTQQRNRVCLDPRGQCYGPAFESRNCDAGMCPGHWDQWCEWSTCSVTCGEGDRRRTRYCQDGYGKCIGNDFESIPCHMPPCSAWLEWGQWSDCSVSCGGGVMVHYRQCNNGYCPGSSTEEMRCNEEICPCWSDWTKFTPCSATCGEGTQTRTRYCEHGGQEGVDCLGQPLETLPCHMPPCAQWSEWGQYDACSVTCGQGVETRNRYCNIPGACPGPESETRQCQRGPCPVWSDWQQWGQCSVTCDDGTQTRKRYCNGYGCVGNDEETQPCKMPPCPTWGQWGVWSQCSVTCATGIKTRDRTCIGGFNCPGERQQTEPCELGQCPTWSNWMEWEQCSVSCGDGTQTRRRYCQYGTDCQGQDQETKYCQLGPCANWTPWGDWGACSAQCGPGQKTRERQCMTMYQRISEDCPGLKQESIPCDAGPCCQWSDWCGWSVCDRDCGGGKKIRQRFCQRPGFGGEMVTDPGCNCPGSDKEIQDCNQHKCPPQCAWTEWCPWSQCPDKDACKNATMSRTRQCVGETGCSCYGFAEEKQFCRREAVCDPPIVQQPNVRHRRRTE